MKKGLVASYIAGVRDTVHGESYNRIIRYFIPEFITSFLLYSVPVWLDAYFIGLLESTAIYGTLGATNNFIHLIIKIAEAFSVGTIILSGKQNGKGDFEGAGRALRDAFWTTCIIGTVIATILFFGASVIYTWYVPAEMVPLGVPFLRLRAVSVLLMFVFFAFAGFLRGVKNTKAPMFILICGISLFIFFDYSFILGKFGFPVMGLQGSAVASIIQYSVMLALAIGYVLWDSRYNKYAINLFSVFSGKGQWKDLLRLSLPVMCDKATLAFAYIWLCNMMKPMGAKGVATFCLIKDMERFALVPAIAFAQVITLLVSNDFGMQNWQAIKSNIKKVIFLTSTMVFTILFFFSLYPKTFMCYFDRKGEFSDLAARIFPILSVLVLFDVLQLILSGALRGSGNVRLVMIVRLIVCIGYFVPVSYLLTHLPIEDMAVRLVLIYGSFYIGNALMNIVYITRFRRDEWKVTQ
jgi:MATE family multidrug resistance protein